ncbi:MAG: signal transduction histidine kinase/CheY-like chemotaxis protein [Candidatus Azotimanducaceae bacterium]|jgi:signal transduction histidine kinase/CheY-like chemotaxis protein
MSDNDTLDPPVNRERFLSILNDITYAALEIQDLDELMQLLADRLADIIGADGCYLTQWEEASGQTIPGAAYGELRDTYKTVIPEQGEATITAAVLKLGKALIIDDAWNSKYASSRITRQFPAQSILALPIIQGKKKFGAALIAFHQHHQFSASEIENCEQAARQISLAIGNLHNVIALKASEEKHRISAEAMKQNQVHLDEAQANARMGSWENQPETDATVWSKELYRLFGIPESVAPPNDDEIFLLVDPKDRGRFARALLGAVRGSALSALDFKTVQGRQLVGHIHRDENSLRLSGTLQDVTEQRQLEGELVQARKMEAVGTLAGGIAHNFNNILTVIMGNYEILRPSTTENSVERKVLDQCLEAAERAASLTRQLLVVSRKQELSPSNLNLNVFIADLVDLLRPLIGDHIAISTTLSPSLGRIYADKGYLEQVIMNLILNARDALEAGGTLNIETKNVTKKGQHWAAITVTDNGPGIDSHNLPNIFDAFYTTKAEGKGTGLGLATVASIVEQSNGTIDVDSTPGKGTSISVFLPISEAEQNLDQSSDQSSDQNVKLDDTVTRHPNKIRQLNQGMILLVEDHESLRNIARFVLEEAGYQVLAAEDGLEALKLAKDCDHIDLLLTDVQLPEGLSGPRLAEKLKGRGHDLPTIFMSGLRDKLPEHATFLAKPFRPHELIAIVSEAIGYKAQAGGKPRVSE